MWYNEVQQTLTNCSEVQLKFVAVRKHAGGKGKMAETSQAIVAIKREVQLAEWQRQIQARQEQGVTVDEWCMNMGIRKGAYYYRLRRVRAYMVYAQ